MKFLAWCLTLMLVSCATQPVNAARLEPPFPAIPSPAVSKPYPLKGCEAPPSPLIDLKVVSIYEETDPTASTVDPVAEEKYKHDTAPLHDFENKLSRYANLYYKSQGQNLSAAHCALEWMYQWAQAGALTGETSRQGQAVRKWSLASLSTAYLQFGSDRRLNGDQKVVVKKWLFRLMRQVVDDYTKDPDSSSRRNNHVYWAAWAVGSTSVVLQKEDYFEWAVQRAKIGLSQIEEDGTLPLEVRRASRAQMYHLFATIPLVMMAELADANGVDLYNYNKGALHRLVKLDILQMDHNDYMQHRAGEKQIKMKEENMQLLLSWIEPYTHRFIVDDPAMSAVVDRLRQKYWPFFNRRIGGDAALLYGRGPQD